MLSFIVLLGLAFGWLGRENRRAREQESLLAELAVVGVRVVSQEPTTLWLWVAKHVPQWESRLRDRVGEGWLSRPTVFTCTNINVEQIPFIADRLRRLGTVREVHYQNGPLTGDGVSRLRSGLPGVNVAPRDRRDLQTYSLSQYRSEHFASGVFVIDLSLAAGLLVMLLLVLRSFVRLMRKPHAA
jgi:hypothetical protein